MTTEQQVEAPEKRQSRVGKRPVPVPKGVQVDIKGQAVQVKGPKGSISHEFAKGIVFSREGDVISVTSSESGSDAPRLQGLGRALLASMVKGAAEGYERSLELVGTGYRCEVKGNKITLQVGLSHIPEVELPPGVSATVPPDSRGGLLILTSADKAVLGQVAASIRALRPPEPYGGKGIRYRGERIRRKAGKAGKGRK